MFGTLALAVRLVGRIGTCLADVHDPGCPALTEVELFCAEHEAGWFVHVWPVHPPLYQPYAPSNVGQDQLLDTLVAVAVRR